ncbi:MAG: hypothetical protein U5R06_22430 [candidate division KSB1 bacterium]|nr:hypothetical protein [candidate division KSB1 bacterium]
MKNRWIGGIAVLMSMILLFSACDDSKNVARLNNSFLTMEAFKYYLSSEKVDQSSLIFETAEIRLNDFIDKRLVIESAYKDSIHLQSALQNKVKEKEENMVYLQVIRDQVYSEVMPEKMMREIYKKQGLEFGISHIFIPVSPQMPKTEISNARQKLKTVHNRLLKGARF